MEVLEDRTLFNVAPVAVADSYSTHFGTTLNVNAAAGLLANDSDADSDPLNVPLASVTMPANGTVGVGSDGSFTYIPNSGYVGSDTFSYRANDGTVDSSVVTVTINVTNTVPSSTGESYHVHGYLLSVGGSGVLSNDSDSDGDTLTAVLVSGPSFGYLSLNSDGSFNYTPNMATTPLFTGSDSFSYQPFDGAQYGSTVTVSLTDTAPVSVADSYSLHFNTTLNVAAAVGLLANDTDADGDSLSVSLVTVSTPAHGGLAVSADGSFVYAPWLGFVGVDSFTYRATDGTIESEAVTVTITVSDSAPVAANDTYFMSGNSFGLTVLAPGVLDNDTDADGDVLTAVQLSNPSFGSAFLLASGAFSYAPGPNFSGSDSFTYQTTDGGLASAPATITIIDRAPVSGNDAYTAHQGRTLTVASPGVLANDTDADSDHLTVVVLSQTGSGTLLLNPNGSFSYTPNAGFLGTDQFAYAAHDGLIVGNTATVTIDVTDTAPVAQDDYYTVDMCETLTVSSPGVLENDSDSDEDELHAVWASDPSNGTLTLNSDGSFTYEPDLDWYGTDSFTYYANDGALDSNLATVTIEVIDTRPTVTVSDVSQNEGHTATTSFTFTVSLSNPTAATVTVDYATADATARTSNNDYVPGSGTLIFSPYETSKTIAVDVKGDRRAESDETFTLLLTNFSNALTTSAQATGTILNDDGRVSFEGAFAWSQQQGPPPILTSPGPQINQEGETVALPLVATSPQNSSLTFAALGLPSDLTIDPSSGVISGDLGYSAAQSFGGLYQVVVVVIDAEGGSTSASFPWEIANVNRPPSLAPISDQSSNAGETASLPLGGSDPANDPLSYSVTRLPPGLTLDIDTITGTIAPDADGIYAVTVEVSDGAATATQSFNWTVVPITALTLVTPADQWGQEGDSVSLQLVASGGGTLTYDSDNLPPGLSLDAATGAITGILAPGSAADTPYWILVTVNDGLRGDDAIFRWTVTPWVNVVNPGNQINAENESVTLQITASGLGGGALSYDAEGLPSGLAIDPASGEIAGIIDTGESRLGPLDVVITVTQGSYSTRRSFVWTVTRIGDVTPQLTYPGNQFSTVGAEVLLPIFAFDLDDDVLRYSATGLPESLSIDPLAGVIGGYLDDSTFRLTPYSVTVTVDDGHGGVISQTFSWTVSDTTLSIQGVGVTATAGTPLKEALLATFVDGQPSRLAGNYDVELDWGNGILEPGIVVADEDIAGLYKVYGSHTYGQSGSATIIVKVYTPVGTMVQTSSTATVFSSALTATGGFGYSSVIGGAAEGQLALIRDGNPETSAAAYSALINWGDGTSSSGSVVGEKGTFVVTGAHAYAHTGSYTITVLVVRSDGASAQAVSAAQVGELWTGKLTDLTVATFTSAVPLGALSATINWGDGSSSAGVIEATGADEFEVQGQHRFAAPGTYTATVTVSDSLGACCTLTDAISVVRQPMTGYGTTVEMAASGSLANSLLALFVDPTVNANAALYSAVVEWGDGTSSAGTVVAANGLIQVLAGHNFAQVVARQIAVKLFWNGGLIQAVALTTVAQPAVKFVPGVGLVNVLKKNFATWAGADKKLTLAEVNTLMEDHALKGVDAAALALLKGYVLHAKAPDRHPFVKNLKDWDPVMHGLKEEDIDYFAENLKGGKLQPVATALQAIFTKAVERIKDTKKELFPKVAPFGETNPSWTSLSQGMIGDCAFLAATGSLLGRGVAMNKAKFQARFKDAGNNAAGVKQYEVTFGDPEKVVGVEKVTVSEPTDAQIALYASSVQGGLWLSVWEKAYVTGINDLLPKARRAATVYEVFGPGQHTDEAIKQVFGHPARRFHLNLNDDDHKKDIRAIILAAVSDGRLITADTPPNPNFEKDRQNELPSLHAMTVVSMGANGQMVIQNPWGKSAYAPDGMKYGGRFTMSFNDFYAKFRFLSVQNKKD